MKYLMHSDCLTATLFVTKMPSISPLFLLQFEPVFTQGYDLHLQYIASNDEVKHAKVTYHHSKFLDYLKKPCKMQP